MELHVQIYPRFLIGRPRRAEHHLDLAANDLLEVYISDDIFVAVLELHASRDVAILKIGQEQLIERDLDTIWRIVIRLLTVIIFRLIEMQVSIFIFVFLMHMNLAVDFCFITLLIVAARIFIVQEILALVAA